MSGCQIEGCNGEHRARGLCIEHYGKARRRGMATLDLTPQQRFWAKVDKTGDCWLWTGSLSVHGYGQFHLERTQYAHRISFTWAHGPIGEGLVLDHLCRTPACVNPSHLEPVAQAVNVARGESLGAQTSRTGTCSRGHARTDLNTYVAPNGTHHCRVCRRDLHNSRRLFLCEEFKYVHDQESRELCGILARWYVISGPMYVCWNHKRHWEAQGEPCHPLRSAA